MLDMALFLPDLHDSEMSSTSLRLAMANEVRIPHEVFFHYVAMAGALALGLVLLVWAARRPAGVAAAILGPPGLAGAFIGLTATHGMPLSWAERGRGALVITVMLSSWLLIAGVVVFALRRRGVPQVIQAVAGAFALGVAYLATRAVLG
jgi:hypothetical protein